MLHPVFLAGSWQPSAETLDTFHAYNPATGAALPDRFPVSGEKDLAAALAAAREAALALESITPEARAAFLETYADLIEANAEELAAVAAVETGLAIRPRLVEAELPRTANQLRQAAASARERSWCRATIDVEAGIRSYLGPLGGAVVIFGPNNFPFAYNAISGGDFAGAIAAGNPVIAKAHPAHPETTRRLALLAAEALKTSGLPSATVQLLYHLPPELGLQLVSHPTIGAFAFTGGRPAGLKLKEAADRAGKPAYLEMSSLNPVFVLPGALEERSSEIIDALSASCTLGAGQFCTQPGLIFTVAGPATDTFCAALGKAISAAPSHPLLTPQSAPNLAEATAAWKAHGASTVTGGQRPDGPAFHFENSLLRVSAADFLRHAEALQTEAFGPVSLLVEAESVEQLIALAESLEGNLTGSLYSHTEGKDDSAYDAIAAVLRPKVGRLLNDKPPTGVAVVPAMNHGGPFPATGHPGFSAVGFPASMLRFAALRSYDNVRPHRLPEVLQDPNPTGTMWRLINNTWSQSPIKSSSS